ncbi:hypothetical protein EPO04_01725 [Patescibacteria group bacterium]|nr:MAG: hypothetical protein EPO04_01725 [Patescibacteria group bacterium]
MNYIDQPGYEEFKEAIKRFHPDTQERLLRIHAKNEQRWRAHDEDFYAVIEDTTQMKKLLRRIKKRLDAFENKSKAVGTRKA